MQTEQPARSPLPAFVFLAEAGHYQVYGFPTPEFEGYVKVSHANIGSNIGSKWFHCWEEHFKKDYLVLNWDENSPDILANHIIMQRV